MYKKCSNEECASGGKLQPLENFHRNRSAPQGRTSRCAVCLLGARLEESEEANLRLRRKSLPMAQPLTLQLALATEKAKIAIPAEIRKIKRIIRSSEKKKSKNNYAHFYVEDCSNAISTLEALRTN